MKNLFGIFTGKSKNGLKLEKSRFSDDWMVKKGYSTLYMGTKEKCEIFINQGMI